MSKKRLFINKITANIGAQHFISQNNFSPHNTPWVICQNQIEGMGGTSGILKNYFH
jgi:hypothetical protein